MSHTIHTGDSAETLKQYPDNHFDSIVTDPPYGIAFLGKDWDSFRATKVAKSQVVKNLGTGMRMTTHRENLNYQQWCEQWSRECLRVLKPGGYLLAFSAARLYHRIAAGLEDAGFEIRDQLMWIYSSGFPKAQDIGKAIQRRQGVEQYEEIDMTKESSRTMGFSVAGKNGQLDAGLSGKKVIPTSPEAKQWAGWKTALKPAHEPIVMARKPFKGSTIDNVLTHGVGALNIDASRVPWGKDDNPEAYVEWMKKYPNSTGSKAVFNNAHADAKGVGYVKDKDADINKDRDVDNRLQGRFPSNVLGDIPEYQKYFYCPKVSRRERHCGFEQTNIPAPFGDVKGAYVDGERMAAVTDREGYANMGNNHPTVKPVALMRYLIELTTPPNSKVLDPFCGSGSTGMAACELGHEFVGSELDSRYVTIANRRIQGWLEQQGNPDFDRLFDDSSD